MQRHGLPAGIAKANAQEAAGCGAFRARGVARLAAACLLALLVPLVAAPVVGAKRDRSASRVTAASEFYGMNVQSLFGLPTERWDAHLGVLSGGGIDLLRTDASWDAAEPNATDLAGQHTYDWSQFDARVAAMARHGVRWYPVMAYSTPWASSIPGYPFAPPARDEDYVAYVTAFAARYGRGGSFWAEHPELPAKPVESYEIWNEPNFARFWRSQETAPVRYATLYASSRAALKRVDPEAQVVVGGLVDWSGPWFVRQMYRARPDLRGNVDAIGYHEYHYRLADVRTSLRTIRTTLRQVGDPDVPIEVTEVGWSANMSSEDYRARVFGRLVREAPAWRLGITRLMPFTWSAEDAGPGAPFWGLADEDATLRPAGRAYIEAVEGMASGANPGRQVLGRAPAYRSSRSKRTKRNRRAAARRSRR